MFINESGTAKEIMVQPSYESSAVPTKQLKNVRLYTTYIEICPGRNT